MSSEEKKNGATRSMVVGLDGSTGSLAALDWAASKTHIFGRIQPIGSWRYPIWAASAPVPGSPPPPSKEWFEMETGDTLRRSTHRLAESDCLEPIVAHGHAGRVLCDAAADASLLVVGSRGRSALVEATFGSVSSFCAAHSETPVAIIPENSDDLGLAKIAVGVDGSENSILALTWALDNAPADAEIEAIYCLSPVGPAFEAVVSYLDVLREHGYLALETAIARATERTAKKDERPDVKGSVVLGDPRAVLSGRDVDLVVVGARGHRGVTHLVLGSVATSLAHHTEQPTVIVPSHERRSDRGPLALTGSAG